MKSNAIDSILANYSDPAMRARAKANYDAVARRESFPAKRGGMCEGAKRGDPIFIEWLKDAGLPLPITEYRFHPTRKWRMDYAWPSVKVAIEVDGGAWIQGRHTRGKGFIADQEKRNAATGMGWRVFNVTPDTLASNATIATLAAALTVEAAGERGHK